MSTWWCNGCCNWHATGDECLWAENESTSIRAYNVRIMHDDGNHHHCDLTSNCRKEN